VSASTASRSISPIRLASLLAPPLLVMGAIFLLSAQPSDGDHGVLAILLRKLAHVTEYAALTLCWWRALRGLGVSRDHRVTVALSVALALAYSVSDEFHQTFVSGRHGTPVDILIDVIGMAIGSGIVLRAYARRRALGPSRPSAA
jgi:VanZ family protein